MGNIITRQNGKDELLLDMLKAAGDAAGIHYGRGKIKKSVSRNLSMVDGLMKAAFTRNDAQFKSKTAIELGSLGFIGLYNIMKGVKHKHRGLIAEGIFLSLALAAIIFTSNAKNKRSLPSIERIR